MLVRFFAMVDLVQKKAEVVFRISKIISVLRLFKMVTRGGVFD